MVLCFCQWRRKWRSRLRLPVSYSERVLSNPVSLPFFPNGKEKDSSVKVSLLPAMPLLPLVRIQWTFCRNPILWLQKYGNHTNLLSVSTYFCRVPIENSHIRPCSHAGENTFICIKAQNIVRPENALFPRSRNCGKIKNKWNIKYYRGVLTGTVYAKYTALSIEKRLLCLEAGKITTPFLLSCPCRADRIWKRCSSVTWKVVQSKLYTCWQKALKIFCAWFWFALPPIQWSKPSGWTKNRQKEAAEILRYALDWLPAETFICIR